jgi:outer membrane lipoprotein-sorting protein
MRRNIKIYLVILVSCLSFRSDGQEYRKIFLEMKAKYESMESFHIVMQVIVNEQTSASPLFQDRIDLKKDGVNYRYEMRASDMLMNDQYVVMVDKGSREIIVSRRSIEAEKAIRANTQFNIDSLMSFYEEPKYLGEENGTYHYQLSLKRGAVKTIDLYINKQTVIISKMRYVYTEGQVVSIVFEKFDAAPDFTTETFNEKNYITTVKGQLKPSAVYQQYKVIAITD